MSASWRQVPSLHHAALGRKENAAAVHETILVAGVRLQSFAHQAGHPGAGGQCEMCAREAIGSRGRANSARMLKRHLPLSIVFVARSFAVRIRRVEKVDAIVDGCVDDLNGLSPSWAPAAAVRDPEW